MSFAPLLLALPATAQIAPQSVPRFGSFGIDLTAGDQSVRPGDDFWHFVNGSWAARVEFPASVDAVGVAPQVTRDMEAALKGLFEEIARDPGDDPYARLVGAFYSAWIDADAIERWGLAPARPFLDSIAQAHTARAVERLLVHPEHVGPIAIEVLRDPESPNTNILRIGQGELGMARDYYLESGARYDAYRDAYLAYLTRLLEESGFTDGRRRAARIVALETRLAKAFWSPAEQRDMTRNDQRMTPAQLRGTVPQLDWDALFAEGGFDNGAPLIIGESTALAALGQALRDTPTAVWQDYLRVRFLSEYADFLPARFADARFAFYGRTLAGMAEPMPRWRRGVVMTNDRLGDAVSHVYATHFLDPSAMTQVRAIFEDLRDAFHARIERSTWMDAPTKEQALAKVDGLTARIGAPKVEPNYAGLAFHRGDALANAIALARFQAKRARQELTSPGSVPEWPFRAQDVNGFFYASANSVMLAGGLLVPPFFDPAADPAVNYGAIGAFIGHEMGHAFDDHGSRYDAGGRETDWWTADSRRAFAARTAALKAQYDSYEALPGLPVDGTLTLGENIADLSGLEAAYDAYRLYQQRSGAAPVIAGLTGEQRFFLANAQMRRTMLRDDVARQLATLDSHAPPRLRVNGAMRNMDGWYAAFNVRPGDALFLAPEQRIHIW